MPSRQAKQPTRGRPPGPVAPCAAPRCLSKYKRYSCFFSWLYFLRIFIYSLFAVASSKCEKCKSSFCSAHINSHTCPNFYDTEYDDEWNSNYGSIWISDDVKAMIWGKDGKLWLRRIKMAASMHSLDPLPDVCSFSIVFFFVCLLCYPYLLQGPLESGDVHYLVPELEGKIKVVSGQNAFIIFMAATGSAVVNQLPGLAQAYGAEGSIKLVLTLDNCYVAGTGPMSYYSSREWVHNMNCQYALCCFCFSCLPSLFSLQFRFFSLPWTVP